MLNDLRVLKVLNKSNKIKYIIKKKLLTTNTTKLNNAIPFLQMFTNTVPTVIIKVDYGQDTILSFPTSFKLLIKIIQ